MEGTSCDSSYHCRDGYPCQSCRSVLECPAPQMCRLSPQDQHVCQSHHWIAEAVTGVLGGAQFPSCSFYHPRSSRSRFRPTRNADICAGNFSDSNGISDDFKRQKRSHQTEPVPLIHVEQIFEENIYTVQGHMLHERVDESAEEIRGDIRIERGLSLWSKRLGLVGRADVVEFDGDVPYPIEYKRSPRRQWGHDALQLCAQA